MKSIHSGGFYPISMFVEVRTFKYYFLPLHRETYFSSVQNVIK